MNLKNLKLYPSCFAKDHTGAIVSCAYLVAAGGWILGEAGAAKDADQGKWWWGSEFSIDGSSKHLAGCPGYDSQQDAVNDLCVHFQGLVDGLPADGLVVSADGFNPAIGTGTVKMISLKYPMLAKLLPRGGQ